MAFHFYCYAFEISLLCIVSSFVYSISTIPSISEVKVMNETFFTDKNSTFLKVFLQLNGKHFTRNMRIRPTVEKGNSGSECSGNEMLEKYELQEEELYNSSSALMSIVFEIFEFPFVELSLCVFGVPRTSDNYIYEDDRAYKWLHQEKSVSIRTKNDHINYSNSSSMITPHQVVERRIRREDASLKMADSNSQNTSKVRVQLYGVRLESADPGAVFESNDGEPTLLVDSVAKFYLFGSGWTKETTFVWTEKSGAVGSNCEYIIGEKTKLSDDENETALENANTVVLNMKVPAPTNGKFSASLYFCCRGPDEVMYYHLGSQSYTRIKIQQILLPFWMQMVIIVVCLSFSSLFSGLNLGLLSLNRTDLKIISNTGTEVERKYAKAIYPVRLHGNYLLCSILLGNVLVNSIFTILLEDMFSGLVAVVLSTLCIVICGEICPQAVCSRHGLAIGAKTIYITKTVMVLTAPLSWPLSHLLDKILGEEIATTYTRERLKELVKVTTGDLEKDEVNIISGALELRKKTVGDVMTRIEDVYMLSHDTILDFETVSEIMKSGYSRIPVYEGTRRNIVSLLYIKDLALIDPDDNTPLKTLSQFYQNSCYYVFEDTTLDVVFKQFKDGCKGHMAFVHRVNNEGEGDPFYETVGIVTLEDVIEELIQAEIMDETDVYTDNRTKQRRSERMLRNQDFSLFAERNENQRVHISPQLNLAAFQFLSSSVDAFKSENVSEPVLLRLLKHDIIYHIKMRDKEKKKDDPSYVIYQQGKPADYFVLILEGRVEVTVGRESLIFESGPFTYFGSQALIPNIGVAESPTNVAQPMGSLQSVNLESMLRHTFIPDYTVRAVTEVFYLLIKRSLYFAAKKATLMERSKKVSNAGEHFDDEVEKLLHNFGKSGSGDDDTKSQVSRDGSFSNPQNIQYIEDSARSTPVNQENVNNGFISRAISPSRTPHTTDQIEEKTTLLGVSSSHDDRTVHGS